MPAQLYVWNGERASVGSWRDLRGVGMISPVPGSPSPSVAFINHCCDVLARRECHTAVTPALAADELATFRQAGFETRERLGVLTHHLDGVEDPDVPFGVTIRKARSGDTDDVLNVDAQCFDHFWQFDRDALHEALTATPQTRFRVAVVTDVSRLGLASPPPAKTVLGYAITGRNRTQGFLQRLAVARTAEGIGLGTALVHDALVWLARRRSQTCVVNTQEANERALHLYRSCGFGPAPRGLEVLHRPLVIAGAPQ